VDNTLGLVEIVLLILATAMPILVGVIFGFWAQLKAKALESNNKFDDKLVELAERLAQRIVDAKNEPPNTSLGDNG